MVLIWRTCSVRLCVASEFFGCHLLETLSCRIEWKRLSKHGPKAKIKATSSQISLARACVWRPAWLCYPETCAAPHVSTSVRLIATCIPIPLFAWFICVHQYAMLCKKQPIQPCYRTDERGNTTFINLVDGVRSPSSSSSFIVSRRNACFSEVKDPGEKKKKKSTMSP